MSNKFNVNWKTILPPGLSIKDLSFTDCRNFKKFYELMVHSTEVNGPKGFKIFYQLLHYLFLYGLCCIEEHRFPVLNNCWEQLSPLFLTKKGANEWFVVCWIFCDFPLNPTSNEVLLDHYVNFGLDLDKSAGHLLPHLESFGNIMKHSRLGLYQEIASTDQITTYKELFTNNVITTVRAVPYYESGEIFLTRIISYLGDNFVLHDSFSYPATAKTMLSLMIENKLSLASTKAAGITDYISFMKLAGPYWMSCSTTDELIPILAPDQYLNYYKEQAK